MRGAKNDSAGSKGVECVDVTMEGPWVYRLRQVTKLITFEAENSSSVFFCFCFLLH